MTSDSPTGTAAPRRPRPLLIALIGLLVLALAGGGYYVYRQQSAYNNVKQEGLLPSTQAAALVVPQDDQGNLVDPKGQVLADDQGQPIDASTLHVDAEGRVVDSRTRPLLVLDGTALPKMGDDQKGEYLMGVKSNAAAQPSRAASAGNALNFLVVGTDKADGGSARSDVIVVAHISSDRKRVDLIHVPRDYYVTIPGQGKNKINAAYASGGTGLLVQTLQPLLGVPIDHVATVDFEGFRNMVDALGGVNLPVDGQRVRMNGDEALKWVRERKSLGQGDISRGQRQMQFIRAVMMEYLGRSGVDSASKASKLIDVTAENVVVDDSLPPAELKKLAQSLDDVNGERLTMHTAPWTSAGPGPHGMAIVNVSEPQLKKLATALQTDSMQGYTDDVSPRSGFGG
ncbi:LCP family protein [Luteococcus sp.]|uniref:LCP family glycopolymer transferase n=1 Tax=Luteococcus sp. TaxID=1969402 RepID=UPI0037365549